MAIAGCRARRRAGVVPVWSEARDRATRNAANVQTLAHYAGRGLKAEEVAVAIFAPLPSRTLLGTGVQRFPNTKTRIADDRLPWRF